MAKKPLYHGDKFIVNGQIFTQILPMHSILYKRRIAMRLTQEDVANAAQITVQQYQQYESGERNLAAASFRIGIGICRALKIDPFEL